MGTRVTEVVPQRVELITGAKVRVTVRGHVVGVIACGAERRFCLGRFEETFWVNPQHPTPLKLWGIGGSCRQQLVFDAKQHLHVPTAVVPSAPRLPRFDESLIPRPHKLGWRKVCSPRPAFRAPHPKIPSVRNIETDPREETVAS